MNELDTLRKVLADVGAIVDRLGNLDMDYDVVNIPKLWEELDRALSGSPAKPRPAIAPPPDSDQPDLFGEAL